MHVLVKENSLRNRNMGVRFLAIHIYILVWSGYMHNVNKPSFARWHYLLSTDRSRHMILQENLIALTGVEPVF